MTRSLAIFLTLPLLLAGCSTVAEKRDCSIVPSALSETFGSDEGYLLFSKSMRRPGSHDNALKIARATEYLARPDSTEAGQLHFLQSRARAYSANDDRNMALKDYKALAALPHISTDRRRYFEKLVATGDFPLAPQATPLPSNVVDAKPMVRIPPRFPNSFLNRDNSGHCAMLFDINPIGKVVNAKTEYCTHDDIREASLESISLWKYTPKIVDGKAVVREGIKSRISFDIQDQCGYHFPE